MGVMEGEVGLIRRRNETLTQNPGELDSPWR